MSIEQSRTTDQLPYDPTLAYFSHISADPTPITPQNVHLTIYNERDMRTEILYQGSADIVGMLHLYETTSRELAFFDSNGSFYDHLVLKSLETHVKRGGNRSIKHDAVFASKDEGMSLSIPIDNIYSLGGAYRHENDLTNPLNA